MPVTKDPISFTDALADILRLPDEAIAMSYVYSNRYTRFQKSSPSPDPLDPYTLALACLSLGSKSTEAPRRLREIIFPAHRLLHQYEKNSAISNPKTQQPLTVPSEMYDTFRATLVQAELVLLRVLAFELRVPLPLDYLPRYLDRAMGDVVEVAEDYDKWGKEEKEEYGVVRLAMDTAMGKACIAKAISACKNYHLANFYPARAVALGCLYTVMEERGLKITGDRRGWVDNVSSRKVDTEDFDEVVEAMKLV